MNMTLYELNNLVRRSIETLMDDEYWVEAEVSELRESRGHCYIELVQNDERESTPVARASAKCWRQTWSFVRPMFERTTGQTLHAGMKVLLKVYPQFHEAYGFSWIVVDIDPTFTLGDMARKRMEIVAKLKEEGVFDLNKSLPLPMFAQRVAVISSATAAGYGDFCRQIEDNDYGYRFAVTLFTAVMQGEAVEQSVIGALNAINDDIDKFDCVVIIRGGGAVSDMSGFDTLALAENVANFPIPVITGIGHDRDETVLDMVAHTRVKTPTAAAAFLVANLKSVADTLEDYRNRIVRMVSGRLENEHLRVVNMTARVPILFSMVKARQDARIAMLASRLTSAAKGIVTERRHKIDLLANSLQTMDPELLLRRGYSITLYKGKAVRDASMVAAGEEIVTRLGKGTIISVVK